MQQGQSQSWSRKHFLQKHQSPQYRHPGACYRYSLTRAERSGCFVIIQLPDTTRKDINFVPPASSSPTLTEKKGEQKSHGVPFSSSTASLLLFTLSFVLTQQMGGLQAPWQSPSHQTHVMLISVPFPQQAQAQR